MKVVLLSQNSAPTESVVLVNDDDLDAYLKHLDLSTTRVTIFDPVDLTQVRFD